MSKNSEGVEPLEKRLFMAQRELMNNSEALVDVIINVNNMVDNVSDKWSVSYDYMMEWLLGILPFKKREEEDDEE